MKLRNLAIFAIALSLPLAACGGDDAAEDGALPADSALVAPAPLPPAPMPVDSGMVGADTMSHDSMSGMSHDSMADTTKM